MTARPRRTGLTLVEVLVAALLLATFAASIASALVLAARFQREAQRVTARTGAWEPFVLVAGGRLDALPACASLSGSADGSTPGQATPGEATPCRLDDVRCDVDGMLLICDGGELRKVRLAWWSPARGDGATGIDEAVTIDVWSRTAP